MNTTPSSPNPAQLIEPKQWAQQARCVDAEFDLRADAAHWSRLHEALAADSDEMPATLRVKWQFELREHRAVVEGTLRLSLPLQCQRCLQVFIWEHEAEVKLCLLKPGEREENLPSGYEAVSLDAEQVPLSLLVEEEALLSLPLAATHEVCPDNAYQLDTDSPAAAPPEATENVARKNPFSVLAELKKPN